MNLIPIKPEFLQVLHQFHDKNIAIGELTQAYLESPNCLHTKQKAARQFVYRNILRMIKAELIAKHVEGDNWPRYRLMESFNTHYPKEEAHAVHNSANTTTPSSSETTQAPKPDSLLRKRLSQYRSDMLCAIGEAEEYEALCKEVPALRDDAQPLYNAARERSEILLGKIKAVESLLIQQPS
ncbi:hypothetical protein [Gynuella sunshinyii]|uniref:Response regulator n=1 Tax=Gynuella sunshinyii YC6258 TaxID=1445510 RepID=A0A0C5VPV5_9GAMM|nr:hypothetical protein [Gynuella sunshinyii]AJQ92289.1 hypothetical Protein YC6258_00237 [Gynuella sunshinyii YC6258]